MLCSNDGDADYYQGLDSNIDTEAEVEAIIRIFPNVLSTRQEITYGDDDDIVEARYFYYPIQLLSFIPVVARLAIEFGCFEEEDRGGLLCYGNRSSDDENVLRILMHSDRNIITNDRKHHQLVDDKYLLVMKQLRQVGLLKKDDIQRYGLLEGLCFQDVMA